MTVVYKVVWFMAVKTGQWRSSMKLRLSTN